MPRRPRVDMVGYYHVLNRGVERRIVYKCKEDFHFFLDTLCTASLIYDVKVHSYVLMNNHYHILIETSKENLSKYMKHINASYAIYFNKKYKRSGHLWQGRFKSWFVTDDSYLYALIAYIEYNPIKAKIVKKLGEYKYSSCICFAQKEKTLDCLKDSIIFKMYKDVNERLEFIQSAHNERVLEDIRKSSNLVVTSIKTKKPNEDKIKKALKKSKNKEERNKIIYKASQEGFSQHKLAVIVGVSQTHIGRILKEEKKGLGFT